MIKTEKTLDPREELFCSNYTSIGTPTFSRKEASALAAGFSEKSARNTATDLLRKPEVQQRIAELNAENLSRNGITVDSVLANLEHDRVLAREKGDVASAIRATELTGKFLAMFVDRQQVDEQTPERAKLTEEEAAALRRAANIRVMESVG